MDFVVTYAWIGALLFARIGAVLMLAPGWGESVVSPTFRLAIAVLTTGVLAPGMADKLPELPAVLGEGVIMVIGEVLIGLMFGGCARILMSALQVGGQVIGMQSGLAMAQQLDPTIGQSSAVIGVFLSMIAMVLIMAAGIHRMMLQAAVDSYELFPPGQALPVGDAAELALSTVSTAFTLGLQMAAPLLVFALIFNLAIGLVSRLIPQVQIFFIAMPSQIMLGLSLFAFAMGGGLLIWLDVLERYARLDGPF